VILRINPASIGLPGRGDKQKNIFNGGKQMKKRVFTLLLAMVMLVSVLAACGPSDDTPAATPAPGQDTPAATPAPPAGTDPDAGYGRDPYVAPDVVTSLPRNETLFFGGIQWEQPQAWNPHHGQSFNFANAQSGSGTRPVVWETAYMYNSLLDELVPLLADGPFEWNADMTELSYRIKRAAYWSDGTKVTAHDAAYSWYAGQYTPGGNGLWLDFIADVTARDDETVVIHAVMASPGIPVFARMVERYIYEVYILQQAWLQNLLERNNFDSEAISSDPGDDFVWSGPYTRYFSDATRNVLIRDDGYWGQHESMWGTLPTPKYLAALIFADNAGIAAALRSGDIDVSQAFIADIHLFWEQDGLPVSTFMAEQPYGMTQNMPTAHFNMTKPLLRDNVEIRQAIAWATDYDAIIANAMTNQSPTFTQVPRSLFAPTPGEQALFDHAAVRHLQWPGNEVDRANALLDESGKFPRGADGFRTYEGERISLVASCPTGWSDWEAALEIVAAAGDAIGIEITTNFVAEGEFYDNVTAGPPNPDSFDIFMMWTPSLSRVSAWDRTRWLLSDERLDTWPHNWNGANYSMYSNPRATEIVRLIPLTTDPAQVRALYTEAVEIYLTDVPSFSLMYRPDQFHAVNESVWTGFTEAGDGRNVPPLICLNGYAIADLFNVRLVG